MRLSRAVVLAGCGAILAAAGTTWIQAQTPSTAPSQILATDLVNIPGQEALFFMADWRPNQQLPWHAHPEGHEFVYVIQGAVTFEIDGVGSRTVKSGEMLYVRTDVTHRAQNAHDGSSRTLVVRIKDKSKPVMVGVPR